VISSIPLPPPEKPHEIEGAEPDSCDPVPLLLFLTSFSFHFDPLRSALYLSLPRLRFLLPLHLFSLGSPLVNLLRALSFAPVSLPSKPNPSTRLVTQFLIAPIGSPRGKFCPFSDSALVNHSGVIDPALSLPHYLRVTSPPSGRHGGVRVLFPCFSSGSSPPLTAPGHPLKSMILFSSSILLTPASGPRWTCPRGKKERFAFFFLPSFLPWRQQRRNRCCLRHRTLTLTPLFLFPTFNSDDL